MKEVLFVSGVARSGTSALVNVLNTHQDIMMGQERFYWRIKRGQLSPEYFFKDRYLDIQEGDTHNKRPLSDFSDGAELRYDRARYIGDKFPSLFRHFDDVMEQFPAARHVYILRNPFSVVESYEARFQDAEDSWNLSWMNGLEAWNESVGRVARLSDRQVAKFTILQYERFFSSVDVMRGMFLSLGLSGPGGNVLDQFVARFCQLNEKLVPRRDDLRCYVAQNADWGSYNKVCRLALGGWDKEPS
ncbi:sulfotransferase [Wenzhouxiangella sp. AB-CW3]|uniref:sulfotransferase family protein n=1 Tax=Wenzhouxiangella sp. AB-CW3 TaxID=2771012 RepID=UPI00168B7219|nr:sulfotransferase [Wenzhouxiangella sp. AB-CW3]QOC23783.1 sulfotransferase [Wenzhouxiangella sp. AB-CW3]